MPKKSVTGWESPTAFHPGVFLTGILKDLSMTQSELAERISLSKKAVNEIIKGKTAVTRSTARKLSRVLPLSEQYWVNAQNIYEQDKARLEEERRMEEEVREYAADFLETYKELSGIGLAGGLRCVRSNYRNIVLELQKFFGVHSLEYVRNQTVGVAFRKYPRNALNVYTLQAYLRLGERKARQTETKPFDGKKLRGILKDLSALSRKTHPEYLPKAEKMLCDCGVVLAYVPYLKNTHVQGATTWIGDKALIMLTTSKKSEDRFWFNLFHEIGHVLKSGKKTPFIDLENFERDTNTQEEQEANCFATRHLVPQFDTVLKKLGRRPDHEEIERAAEEYDISPTVLAGHIAHALADEDGSIFKYLAPFFKTKINHSNIYPSS